MNDELLEIYLNDHLALLTSELELARRTCSENKASRLGGILDQLAVELEAQRSALRDVLGRIGGSENRIKQGVGWLAEKVGRLKMNGRLTEYSPLSRLLEFESLAVAALERVALWDNLEAVRSADPRLAAMDFSQLRDQAQQHLDAIQCERRSVACDAFLPGSRTAAAANPPIANAAVSGTVPVVQDPSPGGRGVGKTELQITGMVCDACAGHVEKSLREVSGVQSVRVDRPAGRATAEHSGAEDRELVAAVASAGYQAEVIREPSHE